MAQTNALEFFRVGNMAYTHELTEESPQVPLQSPHLKVPLRAHQAAAVHRMAFNERSLLQGLPIDRHTLYSRWGILGDGVGVGKSLTVLAHIAYLKNAPSLKTMLQLSLHASSYIFSTSTPKINDLSSCSASVIIVPHTLFRQWSDYAKAQTNLKVFQISSKRALDVGFTEKLFSSDVILISNTLYSQFYHDTIHIRFKRVYIDEADSIRITGHSQHPRCEFIWLISASWHNILFANNNLWFSWESLNYLFTHSSDFHPDFIESYRERHAQHLQFYTTRFYMLSNNFFRELTSTRHPLRGYLVIRSSAAFIQNSISLPQLFRHTILCRAPINYNIVSGSISAEVRDFLHAGDVESAMQALGVQTEGTINLIQAVTDNRNKELDRLRKTYDFKASLDYSTPQAKDTALLALKQKITHLEDQIKNIQERITNYETEACPICFDEPSEALLTPCCQRVFCATCILTSLTRRAECPLCRANTNPRDLRKIGDGSTPVQVKVDEPPAEPRKKEAILNLLRDNPNGKFLIFSRYDNPFTQIQEEIAQLNITVREVKGNKDVIQSTLNAFQAGKVRCLLLNSMHAGAGLTITAATHVILLHSMVLEEEKQILGRAYRMGRKEPLHVYKLLHHDEIEVSA
jgi:SNF2 family DNA or RNA helicase